ncbi:glucarate dehydratase [Dictyobacter sp. S3.2.2.5]|uniref:glucarate dehydratase n=1 Tax=Dictyobacter halimunensis TaxID=3026934 RepID=A0ABQ6FLT6_9CHLR|nr:glucarate dehydratase [Dictyobacter sp. S3.2.2.5]
MKIVEMRIVPVAIADPPLRSAFGLHAPYALRTIVQLKTDDGLTGLGETFGGSIPLGDLEAARPLVLGQDPYRLTRLEEAIVGDPVAARNADRPWEGRLTVPAQTFAAIEVACYDIIGKATGRPVADLLGGRFRDQVPFCAYLFYKHAGIGGSDGLAHASSAARERDDYLAREALSPEGIVRQAQDFVRLFGFKSIKLKGGVLEPAQEAATIHALREAFGTDIPLRLDPNGFWSVKTSVNVGHELAGALEYLEDPTSGKVAMAEVARQVPMPLATNMCTTTWADIPETVARGSIQILLTDLHLWGGLAATVRLAHLCRVFGWGVSMHSNSHLGISLMAMAHVAAAIPNLTYACDTHYPWQAEEVIAGGKRQFTDGALRIDDTPGLGVELDDAALEQLHAQYLAAGLSKRDDVAEMQKIQPGWSPVYW